MKVKRTLFIGAALVLLGAVLFAAGYWLCGGDVSSINGSIGGLRVNVGGVNGFGSDSGEYSRHEYEFSDGTAGGTDPTPGSPAPIGGAGSLREYEFAGGAVNISLKELCGDVSIGLSPDEKIHLSAIESEHYYLRTENVSGGLSIERQSDDALFSVNIASSPEFKLELLLPAGIKYSLEVENDLGNIAVSGISIAAGEKIKLSCDLGSISGTVKGELADYSVTSHAELGSNSLPEALPLGAVTLEVYSDCGNIDLGFEK